MNNSFIKTNINPQVGIVTNAFDRVDKFFHELLRGRFGPRLDLSVGEEADERSWESLDTKTHVHVYKKTDRYVVVMSFPNLVFRLQ